MNGRVKLAFATTCAILCVAESGDAYGARPSNAWAGTWRLDLARSRFSGAAPRGETRTITVTNNRMSVRSAVVDPAGKPMNFSYSVTLDGRFHPLVGNPDGDNISMRLVTPRKVTIRVRRGSALAATAVTQVSSTRLVMDRRRLKESGSPSEDILVYDRVR